VHGSVLVLNQNYEPLDVCSIRRAVILVIDGKAEILEALDAIVSSPNRTLPLPSVIRLIHLIRRPRPRVKLTRREVFLRDDYTCQYCGRDNVELTIDHVVPRSRGGGHTWDNLVSACKMCNHRKGGKSPAEARMPLRTVPHEPSPGAYYVIERSVLEAPTDGWQAYLPGMTMTPRSRRRSSSSA
jgi:5-methylcytosine-specific restriction endonuclease McrA